MVAARRAESLCWGQALLPRKTQQSMKILEQHACALPAQSMTRRVGSSAGFFCKRGVKCCGKGSRNRLVNCLESIPGGLEQKTTESRCHVRFRPDIGPLVIIHFNFRPLTVVWQGSNVGFSDSLERIGSNRVQDQPQNWKVGTLHQLALLWYPEYPVEHCRSIT